MIWEIAASLPRVVAIGFEKGYIYYAIPHPLLHVSRGSRSVCLESNVDRLELRRGQETQELATNFARDYFLIRTSRSSHSRSQSNRKTLGNLKRVAISSQVASQVVDSDSRLFHCLNVDELNMNYGSESDPEQFRPRPTSEFRHHCYLHHCQFYPVLMSNPIFRYGFARRTLRSAPPVCGRSIELKLPLPPDIVRTLRALHYRRILQRSKYAAAGILWSDGLKLGWRTITDGLLQLRTASDLNPRRKTIYMRKVLFLVCAKGCTH